MITLKKFVSGIIVGALLFAGASAFAAPSSLIGQRVQGIFSIEQGGKKLADAVIINGSAYAPVRAVADATGSSLIVEGKKIIMNETTTTTTTTTTTSSTEGNIKISDLKVQREKINSEITRLENGIKDLEENVLPGFRESAEILKNNKGAGETAKAALDQYEAILSKHKSDFAALQQQLADINAQIAALEK